MRVLLILVLIYFNPIFSFGQNKIRFPIWTFNTTNTSIYGVSVGFVHTKKIENVITNGFRVELPGLLTFPPEIYGIPFCDSIYQIVETKKAKETVNGINVSPLGSLCDCSINGINLTLVASIVSKSKGLSFATFINTTYKHEGIQLSFLMNGSYNFNGLQLSLMNFTTNDLTGMQVGFLLNGSNNSLRGVQIAPFNITGKLHGLQFGLYNKTKKIKGLQIGIINVNEKRILPIINW